MTKPQKISAEAEAAVTEMDFWSLFFTQEVVGVIFGLIRFFILLLSTSFISTQMILMRECTVTKVLNLGFFPQSITSRP
jgi:hypothetical protein